MEARHESLDPSAVGEYSIQCKQNILYIRLRTNYLCTSTNKIPYLWYDFNLFAFHVTGQSASKQNVPELFIDLV